MLVGDSDFNWTPHLINGFGQHDALSNFPHTTEYEAN